MPPPDNHYTYPNKEMSTRSSNFELLRLVLMVMIVIHHCIVHGLGLISIGQEEGHLPLVIPQWQMPLADIINCLCICGVNCFILISGYFKIKATRKKILFLLLTEIFYVALLWTLPNLIEGNVREALTSCFFLSRGYWFVTDYIFLMILSPMINIAFERLSKHTINMILIGLLVISCYFGFFRDHPANTNGYTLLQFITMYFIGRKIAVTDYSLGKYTSASIYISSGVLCGVLMWLAYIQGRPETSWEMVYYNNPLVIISAISLFLLFKNFQFQSSFINRISMSSFGIYLFQSSYLCGIILYPAINTLGKEIGGYVYLVIIMLSMAIATAAILFDQIRLMTVDSIMKIINSRWK